MTITPLFQLTLLLATLLCSLVAGFLFAFAAVVMPGIATLDDAGFLHAFRVIDCIIRTASRSLCSYGWARCWRRPHA